MYKFYKLYENGRQNCYQEYRTIYQGGEDEIVEKKVKIYRIM